MLDAVLVWDCVEDHRKNFKKITIGDLQDRRQSTRGCNLARTDLAGIFGTWANT